MAACVCLFVVVVAVSQVDLFSYRRVFLPVHVHGNHWCLGCVNMDDKRIEYYDSLGGNNDTYFSTMRQYLADEYAAHHNSASSCHSPPPLQLSEWSHYCPKHIPRQDNGSDCGVFTLKFADYLSHSPQHNTAAGQNSRLQHASKGHSTAAASTDPPSLSSVADGSSGGVLASSESASGEEQLKFSASDMEYFRNRIALEIKLQIVM